MQLKPTEPYFPLLCWQGGYNFWLRGWNHKCDDSNKTTEQYITAVQLIMLCKVVLTFKTVDEILKCDIIIRMKAIVQYSLGGSNFRACG